MRFNNLTEFYNPSIWEGIFSGNYVESEAAGPNHWIRKPAYWTGNGRSPDFLEAAMVFGGGFSVNHTHIDPDTSIETNTPTMVLGTPAWRLTAIVDDLFSWADGTHLFDPDEDWGPVGYAWVDLPGAELVQDHDYDVQVQMSVDLTVPEGIALKYTLWVDGVASEPLVAILRESIPVIDPPWEPGEFDAYVADMIANYHVVPENFDWFTSEQYAVGASGWTDVTLHGKVGYTPGGNEVFDGGVTAEDVENVDTTDCPPWDYKEWDYGVDDDGLVTQYHGYHGLSGGDVRMTNAWNESDHYLGWNFGL